MSSFSEFYANSYDQIHANKNYTEETSRLVRFIDKNYSERDLVKILDFGCGTGGHLQSLAKTGRELSGFDISVDMLDIAKQKTTGINFTDNLEDLDSDFDLVYSLFDVINYQVSNDNLKIFLNGVSSRLRPGGYFICDGWNLDGVRLDPPKVTSRDFMVQEEKITRRVQPSFEDNFRVSNLIIDLIKEGESEPFLTEDHHIRAYSPSELADFLHEAGFEDFSFMDGKVWEENLRDDSWRFVLFAKKTVG